MTKHRGFWRTHCGWGGLCIILAVGMGAFSVAAGGAAWGATMGQGPIRNMLPPTRDRDFLGAAPEAALLPMEGDEAARARAPEPVSARAAVAAMDDGAESSFGGAVFMGAVGVGAALTGGGLMWRRRRRA